MLGLRHQSVTGVRHVKRPRAAADVRPRQGMGVGHVPGVGVGVRREMSNKLGNHRPYETTGPTCHTHLPPFFLNALLVAFWGFPAARNGEMPRSSIGDLVTNGRKKGKPTATKTKGARGGGVCGGFYAFWRRSRQSEGEVRWTSWRLREAVMLWNVVD
jgi:hypothetical protein